MKVLSENITEVREGFVVEETLSGCADGCRHGTASGRFSAIPSSEFGDTFQDLTNGLRVGESTEWDELEGTCPGCGNAVIYRRTFVLKQVVRRVARVTEDVIA